MEAGDSHPPGTSSWRRRSLRGGGTWVVDTKWIYPTIDPTKLKLLFLSFFFQMIFLCSISNPWGDMILIWLGSHLFLQSEVLQSPRFNYILRFFFNMRKRMPPKGIIYPLKMNIEPKHTTLEKEDTSTTYKPQIPWLPCEFSGFFPIFTTSQFFPPKISGCAPGDTLEVVSPSSGHPIFSGVKRLNL